MKISKLLYTAMVGAAAVTLTACNSYLDELPDNRTTMDTEDKISDLLTNAYPTGNTFVVNELMSDNSDFFGENNPYGDRFGDEVFFWKDVMESDNEDGEIFWLGSYESIAAANEALQDIDALEAQTTDAEAKAKLEGDRAEALLLRAYNHFKLVTEFSKMYNPETADKDLGIPVSKKVELITEKHERGTVADVYKAIDEDIQAALPIVTDNYDVPKYHFNRKAAYAFAARFYLYYQQWEKVIQYASFVVGSNPSSQLRDWASMASSMAREYDPYSQHYISADLKCNLLLTTKVSSAGVIFGPYGYYKRYTHGSYLAKNEDLSATNIWSKSGSMYVRPFAYNATNADFTILPKLPYLFEYTDPVARVGYSHTVYVDFSTDETLLCRAEAYIITKQYDKACADLNAWMHNVVNTTLTLTPESIQQFYNSVDYSYDDDTKMASTIKKHINPTFAIDEEGSVQETMLQCLLGFRRIQTMHEGLRWDDINRYRIVIPRRTIGSDGFPLEVTDWLTTDDPRRAVQIPYVIRQAGMEANPR